VVLHHIAQSACGVVVTCAAFDTQCFSHGDLYVIDVSCVPERFEQYVGKAQSHEVLYGFFAEVVVDTEDLVFLEDRTDGLVDFVRGLAVFADWLFDGHAGLFCHQIVFA